eukprot:4898518-Amphidinium_carterae.1
MIVTTFVEHFFRTKNNSGMISPILATLHCASDCLLCHYPVVVWSLSREITTKQVKNSSNANI